MSDYNREIKALADTIYGEARGESEEGQEAVGWVIKNRKEANKDHYGGSSYEGVCKKPGQFECWQKDMTIREPDAYERCRRVAEKVYHAPRGDDVTGGCDHYNNPKKEGYPDWTRNCDKKMEIGDHVFYKAKN